MIQPGAVIKTLPLLPMNNNNNIDGNRRAYEYIQYLFIITSKQLQTCPTHKHIARHIIYSYIATYAMIGVGEGERERGNNVMVYRVGFKKEDTLHSAQSDLAVVFGYGRQ